MTSNRALARLAKLARCRTGAVPSPCISVCRMDDESGLCQGCFRTIDEIIVWGRQDDPGRRRIWQHIVHRAGLDPLPALDPQPPP